MKRLATLTAVLAALAVGCTFSSKPSAQPVATNQPSPSSSIDVVAIVSQQLLELRALNAESVRAMGRFDFEAASNALDREATLLTAIADETLTVDPGFSAYMQLAANHIKLASIEIEDGTAAGISRATRDIVAATNAVNAAEPLF